MTRARARLACIAGLAVAVLSACGGSVSPSGGTSSAPSSSAIDLPTFDPALFHAYPELEKRLPTKVGDIALETLSYPSATGTDVEPSGGPDALDAALAAAGKSGADLQLATAMSIDSSTALAIWAMTIPGMSGADLLSILRGADAGGSQEERDVSGKHVVALTDPDGATSYLYVSGDVVFVVGGDPAVAQQALAAIS